MENPGETSGSIDGGLGRGRGRPRTAVKPRKATGKTYSRFARLVKPEVIPASSALVSAEITAVERLGVDALELARAPEIGLMLAETEGGIDAVIKAARFSRDTGVVRFLEAYDDAAPEVRERAPIEAFAIKAKVDILQLLGAMMIAMRQCSVNLVKILAVSAHPETMKARIASAKIEGKEGVKDRDALDKAMRFLPAQKGPTIMFNMPGGAMASVSMNEQGEEEEADPSVVFPGLVDTQKLLE